MSQTLVQTCAQHNSQLKAKRSLAPLCGVYVQAQLSQGRTAHQLLEGTMCTTDLFLQNSLKKFGLNPMDWKILKVRDQKYKIAHIHDGQFYFLGEAMTQKGSPVWS